MEIMILGNIHGPGIDVLKNTSKINYTIVDPNDTSTVDRIIANVDGIIIRTSQMDAEMIRKAKKLRVVSRFGVGFDNIDVEELTRASIPLAVVGEQNAVSVAEHTLYLILAAAKMGRSYDLAVRNGNWAFRETLMARELSGKQMLIVGLGRIGTMVGKLCEAFGMVVSYHDPRPEVVGAQSNWVRKAELDAGLANADFVSMHVPLTQKTQNLIAAREFQLMKKNAVIVSTSRGGVINEADLANALTNGEICAAGLDVFETEPVNEDNPLLALDNVILSPHMAALSLEGTERVSVVAAKNCIDGLQGILDPALVVNPQVLSGKRI